MWRLAGMFTLVALPACAGWPEGVPGAEAARMVRAAMAAAGEAAPDFADPVRGFPACDGEPVVRPRGGSWATAELRCAAPVWVRAIRTGAEPAVERTVRPDGPQGGPMVVTLARSVARGAMIGAGDVVLRPLPERGNEQIFTDPAMVVGRRARVGLGEGQPVLLRQLEPLLLVEAGNPLVLTASVDGLTVSAPAEALEDGQLGDVIRVVNLSSRREVKAFVTGRNIVSVQANIP